MRFQRRKQQHNAQLQSEKRPPVVDTSAGTDGDRLRGHSHNIEMFASRQSSVMKVSALASSGGRVPTSAPVTAPAEPRDGKQPTLKTCRLHTAAQSWRVTKYIYSSTDTETPSQRHTL